MSCFSWVLCLVVVSLLIIASSCLLPSSTVDFLVGWSLALLWHLVEQNGLAGVEMDGVGH